MGNAKVLKGEIKIVITAEKSILWHLLIIMYVNVHCSMKQ